MKLAAIYTIWDDWDMLELSVKNIKPLVDEVIVICSSKSNYGEVSTLPLNPIEGPTYYVWEPMQGVSVIQNETAKRNFGLIKARNKGCTHFLMMDADEFYEHEPFLKEKERFLNPNLKGLVCSSQVYFKSPSLTIGLDTTLVTFIHRLDDNMRFEMNRNYPFAWDKERHIRIDPTRQLNITSGVEWSEIVMHHYSWIRKDFEKKIRNSTARGNIERSSIRQDLALAKEGYFCKFYGKTLIRASVNFNIQDVSNEDI